MRSVTSVWRGVVSMLLGLAMAAAALSAVAEEATPDGFKPVAYLVKRDIGRLQAHYEDLWQQYRAGRIGDEAVYNAFDELGRDANDGQEAVFDEWVARFPTSYVALTARGYYLRAKGGRIRGGKYASQTTSEELAGFHDYMLKARADLEKSLALDDRPVLAYLRLATIAGSIDSPEAARRMRDKALAIEPKSYVAHRIYLKYATPKWGGRLDLMDTARSEAVASQMSAKDKQRYQGAYDYMLGDEMERLDRAGDALTHYWRAYQEGADGDYGNGLERAAWLANRIRRYDEAVKYLDELIRVGQGSQTWARNTRGHIMETQFNKFDKAFDDYTVSAGLGDAWAENKLGWWYYNGIYVAKDDATARKYWQRAADKGNQTAAANLKRLDRRPATGGGE